MMNFSSMNVSDDYCGAIKFMPFIDSVLEVVICLVNFFLKTLLSPQ